MSIKPRYVWRNALFASTLRPAERLVALAFEQYMNGKSASAWPSKKTLALATGLSDRTVQSALHGLVEGGWLEVAAPASQHRPTTYRALLRGEILAPLRAVNETQGSNPRIPGEQITTVRGATASPEPLDEHLEEPLTSTRARARARKKGARTDRARPDLAIYDEAIGDH
jgi:hypothetical protein